MPYYRFTCETTLTPAEVSQRVQAITRADWSLWGWTAIKDALRSRKAPRATFIGTVAEDRFRMRRDIRYGNAFLPRIRGRVLPLSTGSQVVVQMYLHPVVAVFMGLRRFGADQDLRVISTYS